MEEYVTFMITTSKGEEVEMAVMDEFGFEGHSYVAAALVEGDEIRDDGRFIYEVVTEGEEVSFKKITREFVYRKVAEAYMNMTEDDDDADE